MSDLHTLTGAYAVDALDDIERARFEQHLADCEECRAEVASLSEADGLLGEATPAEPPAALRDRVLADIGTVRPLPPEGPEPVVPQRRRRRPLTTLFVAAAAVVAVGAGGTVVWQQPWEDTSEAPPSAAQRVLGAPDARSTSLDFPGGAKATLTHSDSLGKAVLVTHKMPPPPRGSVYQLWLDQPGAGMTPAGVMDVEPDQTVVLDGDAATAKAAGITVEPAGGSEHPTTDPIAVFDFGARA
jgi:hypothetical protein